MIGTRGVPAKYGGFETCVEELGSRLVDRGHSVTVFCRKSYYNARSHYFRGMKLVYLSNIPSKALDTLSHCLFSVFYLLVNGYDIHMVFNAANALTVIPLRLLGKKVIINVDGLEWKRSKWGLTGRLYHRFSEILACLVANRLVADSPGIQNHYRKVRYTDPAQIASGADVQFSQRPELLDPFNLKPRGYFLQITRFEPENNPLLTIRAFKRVRTSKKLVIVGGCPYRSDYMKNIIEESTGEENIILPGFIYDKDILRELWCLCHTYIHGNEVGGTNPALLQSMGAGCYSIALDVSFNRQTLGECGGYFLKNEESLAQAMRWTIRHQDELDDYGRQAQARITDRFNWDRITGL